jgi:hypothetical protein
MSSQDGEGYKHPQRERKRAVDYEDMLYERWPQMLLPLLPKQVRDRIRPVKHKPKAKKAATPAASTGKGKATKAPKKAAAKKAPAAKKAAAPAGSLSYGGDALAGTGFTVTGVSLSRQQTAAADLLARTGSSTHKWQYMTDAGRWADYDPDASRAVEVAYASWLLDPHIDVRCVKSGDWEYMVDFNLMEQQNVKHHAHKRRKIQRIPIKK